MARCSPHPAALRRCSGAPIAQGKNARVAASGFCAVRRTAGCSRRSLMTKPDSSPSPYGFCPKCGAPGKTRERRPDGNDKCSKGHSYPSKQAVPSSGGNVRHREASVLIDRTPSDGEVLIEERTGLFLPVVAFDVGVETFSCSSDAPELDAALANMVATATGTGRESSVRGDLMITRKRPVLVAHVVLWSRIPECLTLSVRGGGLCAAQDPELVFDGVTRMRRCGGEVASWSTTRFRWAED